MTTATEIPANEMSAERPDGGGVRAGDAEAGERAAGCAAARDGEETGSARGPARPMPRPLRKFRQLPFKTRALLTTAGVVLLILGIAGLFLPFLQGILFLVLAAAVFSLASRRVYGWLHRAISERWPRFWTKIERFRTRVLWKYRR